VALRRLFPVDRGVFEDKVGNFWYAAQVFLRARDVLGRDALVAGAAGMTFVAAFPTQAFRCLRLVWPSTRKRRTSTTDAAQDSFLLALHTSALAFFLFSYHVHEKAILLPLAPLLALKDSRHTAYVALFSLVAAFSIFPLLCFEGLRTAYAAVVALHLLLLRRLFFGDDDDENDDDGKKKKNAAGAPGPSSFLAVAAAGLLHVLPIILPPPGRFPDLYPALVALSSGLVFGGAFLLATLFLVLYPGGIPEAKRASKAD